MLDIHVLELSLIQSLHEVLRSPGLDAFVCLWDFFDRAEFLMVLIPFVWFIKGRKVGARLFYLMIIGAFFNKGLKVFFGLPRPSHLLPDIALMSYGTPGFPSGAAQTAVIISSLIIMESRHKGLWAFGLVFGFCLCFSRVYLGLHFPSDILGGIISGLLLVTLYGIGYRFVEKQSLCVKGVVFAAIPLIIAFLSTYPAFASYGQQCGLTLGLGAGLLLAEKEEMPQILPNPILSAFIALIIFIVLWKGAYQLPLSLLAFFLPGFWIAYLCPKFLQIFYKKCYSLAS